MENKLKGRLTGISSVAVKAKLDAGQKPYFLDGRNPNEFEEMELGIGEHLIPLGALRSRLDDLPADKNVEIRITSYNVCYTKLLRAA